MIDWNIQARSHHCQHCRKAFHPKEPFHTLLFDQKHGYERLDVCEGCWTGQFSQGGADRKGFVSHWQSVFNLPSSAPPDPIQKETAETLLRKLIEQNAPEHSAARFILAVMLERKRIFKVKAQLLEQGRRIFIYEHAKSGEVFTIPDPDLHLGQLEEVQKDIAALLQPEGPAAPASAPAPETKIEAAEALPPGASDSAPVRATEPVGS